MLGVDLDRRPGEVDGVASFEAACAAHGQPWPDTLTVQTPSGGQHLYFRTSRPIGSTSGGRSGLDPSVDTRGPGQRRGGYLVAPGSTVAGHPYTLTRDTDIQPLPAWLAALLDRSAR